MAGWHFIQVATNSYNESGAGAANLNIHDNRINSLTQDIGAKAAYKFNTDWGLILPEFRVAWTHDYKQGPMATSGMIDGASLLRRQHGPFPMAFTLIWLSDFRIPMIAS